MRCGEYRSDVREVGFEDDVVSGEYFDAPVCGDCERRARLADQVNDGEW